jgi:tRNA (guanine37-N1)-methyltransferase
MWEACVLTLFPEMFPGPLAHSLAGKGLARGDWKLKTIQIRDFASDKHHTVDDTSYGHNAGMIMKPDVVDLALSSAVSEFEMSSSEESASHSHSPKIIYMTPRGAPLTQNMVHSFSESSGIIVLCGRYEGIDERVIKHWSKNHGMQEVSVGDYILSGGEIAALALIDACVRLLPNIVHNKTSLISESFELDLLEFPQYTKPYDWRGMVVPDVLLSGNHREIAAWQKCEAEKITKVRRPDLWAAYLGEERK